MKKNGVLNVEWGLIIPVFVLALLSLATLFSINVAYFKSQFIYLIISFFTFIFFSNVNYKIFRFYSSPIYIVSLFLLIGVLILGIQSRGAVRWIDIFGLRIQFSEILKPFLIVSFSSFLASHNNYSFRTLILSSLYIFPVAFLVYFQPDLGNTLIYILVSIFTLLVFGFPLIWYVAGFIIIALITPIFFSFLHDYQKQRILTFLNPSHDPLGSSYNSIQSIMAIGSGMFFGKGLGEGTQSILRFLPERHTDFIFAALSEQFGFMGSFIVIISFGFLLYKIFGIYRDSDEKFCRIFISSSFFLILIQLFLNIGMNIGLVPIVGVTLPFVSYGGSSILSNFIILGFLSSIAKDLKTKDTLEIK